VPDVSGTVIANLDVESLKHVKPTFHGDTIYGETEVLYKTESKSRDDCGVVASCEYSAADTPRASAAASPAKRCRP
jgi:acyl dehydratase